MIKNSATVPCQVYSDENLLVVLQYIREIYGDAKISLHPLWSDRFDEMQIIYSRAAAKFQHLLGLNI